MFEGWDSFYLMIGGASGGLIGLLFVVATLTSGLEQSSITRGTQIYTSPTVFHLGVVLVVSAMTMVPHLSTPVVGTILAACAALGLTYAGAVALQIRARKVPEPPHWTDFWCYGVAPTVI